MAKKTKARGFLVRFSEVGAKRVSWEARIERPVTEVSIVREVRRKRALLSREISAPYVHDYSGTIYAGLRPVGSYFIVPGSEQ